MATRVRARAGTAAMARTRRARRRRRGDDPTRTLSARPRQNFSCESEEELPPGGPPVLRPGRDLAGARDLDAGPVVVLLHVIRGVEVDEDLAGRARVVWAHRREVGQRTPRGVLDQLPGASRGELARAEAAEALLDGRRGQPVAEQLPPLPAGGLVAGDEDDRAIPGPAERCVDACLAYLGAVEAESPPRGGADRVREHAVAGAGHRMHSDEERRIDAAFEVFDVLRPLVLDDVLAIRVE